MLNPIEYHAHLLVHDLKMFIGDREKYKQAITNICTRELTSFFAEGHQDPKALIKAIGNINPAAVPSVQAVLREMKKI